MSRNYLTDDELYSVGIKPGETWIDPNTGVRHFQTTEIGKKYNDLLMSKLNLD